MKILSNITLAKWAKATAVTVYFMTGVKAVARPLFNLADKKSDKDSRKYSATNEFLYQIVCLGMAAAMIPLFERVGFKLAEKRLKNIKGLEPFKQLEQINGFKKLADITGFNIKGSKKVNAFKNLYLDETFNETKTLSKEAEEAMHLVNGGIETGSFLASIIGLTILAPKIGHEILHPIMHAIGMEKKKDDIGTPLEPFLADEKVLNEKKAGKININA